MHVIRPLLVIILPNLTSHLSRQGEKQIGVSSEKYHTSISLHWKCQDFFLQPVSK